MARTDLFLVASLLRSAGAVLQVTRPSQQGVVAAPTQTQALLATMVFPSDETPVDIMLEHQIRMIGGSAASIAEVAIIDNRPPWVEQRSPQDPVLERYKRTFGSSGIVNVKNIDYRRLADSGYLAQFFRVVDQRSNTTRSIMGGDVYVETARPESRTEEGAQVEEAKNGTDDGKTKAARFLGMLQFLELCKNADEAVGVCIFVDPDMLVYSTERQGVVELANELFKRDPEAIVLQPPDICHFSKMAGQCSTAVSDLLQARFFVVNRQRLMKSVPLKVHHADMTKGFETIFTSGLTYGARSPVKNMMCGSLFAIHPYSIKYSCKASQMISLPHLAKSIGVETSLAAVSERGYFSTDYEDFGRRAVTGLQVFIERFEAGKFPKVKYPDSVTNRCQDMCPSKERIQQGFAW